MGEEENLYPRVWGIEVGKVEDVVTVGGLLAAGGNDDDATATTAALTTLAGDESDMDSEDEDFDAENEARPPPAKLMYRGQGEKRDQ